MNPSKLVGSLKLPTSVWILRGINIKPWPLDAPWKMNRPKGFYPNRGPVNPNGGRIEPWFCCPLREIRREPGALKTAVQTGTSPTLRWMPQRNAQRKARSTLTEGRPSRGLARVGFPGVFPRSHTETEQPPSLEVHQ